MSDRYVLRDRASKLYVARGGMTADLQEAMIFNAATQRGQKVFERAGQDMFQEPVRVELVERA